MTGLYATGTIIATEAAEVGHAAIFEQFRATVADKLTEVPEREELVLIHVFVKDIP